MYKRMSSRPRKTTPQSKPKVPKSRTVGVKSGIKATLTKKPKTTKEKCKKSQAAPRVEPGYSLYSTDSEEQAPPAHRQTDHTTLLLNQLLEREKGTVSVPSKKKLQNKAQHPFARNFVKQARKKSPRQEYRVSMHIPTAVQAYNEDPQQPYTQASPAAAPNNPKIPFNIRLASSTPDPERVLCGGDVPLVQDFPEKDRPLLQRTQFPWSDENQQNYLTPHLTKMDGSSTVVNKTKRAPPSVLRARVPYLLGGEGFQYVSTSRSPEESPPVQTVFSGQGQPWSTDLAIHNDCELEPRRESHISAFQPYISPETMSITPPRFLQAETDIPVSGSIPTSDRSKSPVISAKPSEDNTKLSSFGLEVTPESSRTDYFVLPRQHQNDGQNEAVLNPRKELTARYQLQDGLYQVHWTPVHSVPGENHVSPVAGLGGLFNPSAPDQVHRGQIWEVPERDTTGSKQSVDSEPRTSLGFTVTGLTHNPGDKTPNQNNQNLDSNLDINRTQVINDNPGPALDNMAGILSLPNAQGRNVSAQTDELSGENTPTNLTVCSDSDMFVVGKTRTTVAATQTTRREITPDGSEHREYDPNPKIMNANNHADIPDKLVHVDEDQGSDTQVTPDVRGFPSHVTSWNRAAVDIGVKRLRYLLNEIKECCKINKDIEVGRLVKELNQTIGSIPQLSPTFNVQTEIDLALQPLRSENSQLRRRLRIVNQQLKERELHVVTEHNIRTKSPDVNFDLIHLQASNAALKKQMQDEKQSKVKTAAELKDLNAAVHKLQSEKHQLLCEASDKETFSLKVRQECLQEVQRLRAELDLARKSGEGVELKLQASEQENHILQITLQQRDLEISRQQEMVETMKQGISELLQELDQTRQGDTSYIQNNSFSLQKLVRLMEGNNLFSPERSGLSDSGKKSGRLTSPHSRRSLSFNHSLEVSPRLLTKQALAEHNHQLWKRKDSRNVREENSLDNESESTLQESPGNQIGKPPQAVNNEVKRHRRTSSASPVDKRKFINKHKRTISCSPAYSSRLKGQTKKEVQFVEETASKRHVLGNNDWEKTESEITSSDCAYVPLTQNGSDIIKMRNGQSPFKPPQQHERVPMLNLHGDSSVDEQESETDTKGVHYEEKAEYIRQNSKNIEQILGQSSMNQSRYSVTDYFKKYPQSYEGQENQIRNGPPPYPPNKSSYTPVSSANQDTLFQGTVLDVSLSAIDDDNLSSISGTVSSISTAATVDDRAFRRGMESLDANIAKLQLSLQKTKQMLDPQ